MRPGSPHTLKQKAYAVKGALLLLQLWLGIVIAVGGGVLGLLFNCLQRSLCILFVRRPLHPILAKRLSCGKQATPCSTSRAARSANFWSCAGLMRPQANSVIKNVARKDWAATAAGPSLAAASR